MKWQYNGDLLALATFRDEEVKVKLRILILTLKKEE
jgi:hypothetical protein